MHEAGGEPEVNVVEGEIPIITKYRYLGCKLLEPPINGDLDLKEVNRTPVHDVKGSSHYLHRADPFLLLKWAPEPPEVLKGPPHPEPRAVGDRDHGAFP